MFEGVFNGGFLNRDQARSLMLYMSSQDCSDVYRAAVLSAFRIRNVTDEEFLGFYDALKRDHERTDATDIVGTGGDMMHTINVSTASAIVAASMGIKTAKFGNRSASGNHGSADFMSYIQYDFPRDTEEALKRLSGYGFVFLFAPNYVKEFGMFAGVRKLLGFPTVLNLLGPLLNPLDPERRILGTSDERAMDLYANVAKARGWNAAIVRSKDGMDEVSPFEKTKIIFVGRNDAEVIVDPSSIHGKTQRSDVISEDRSRIPEMTIEALSGSNIGGARFVALNTAPALIINGFAENFHDAYEMAYDHIVSGSPVKFMERIVDDGKGMRHHQS